MTRARPTSWCSPSVRSRTGGALGFSMLHMVSCNVVPHVCHARCHMCDTCVPHVCHLCATCGPHVCHLCTTCVTHVCHACCHTCATCVPHVGHMCATCVPYVCRMCAVAPTSPYFVEARPAPWAPPHGGHLLGPSCKEFTSGRGLFWRASNFGFSGRPTGAWYMV